MVQLNLDSKRLAKTYDEVSPEEVVTVFESGAAAGYLNRDNYDTDFDEEYGRLFREIIAGAFRSQAGPDGTVDLIFNRVYLVAVKD